MRHMKINNTYISDRKTVNTKSFCEYYDCGRATAVKLGNVAGAHIQIGRRVLWDISKIDAYIDSISKGEEV